MLSLQRSCAFFTEELCYLYRGAVLSLQRSYVIFTVDLCYLHSGPMYVILTLEGSAMFSYLSLLEF